MIAYSKELETGYALCDDIIFPQECEFSYKRWSIDKRNKWVASNSDFIISYTPFITRAKRFVVMAKRKGANIIALEEETNMHIKKI